AIIMITVAASLLLASGAMLGYEVVNLREEAERNLSMLAGMIGANSAAALASGDRRSTQELMQSLRAQPSIAGAVLYSADGSIAATYLQAGGTLIDLPLTPPPAVEGFRQGRPVRTSRVVLDGQTVGTVYVAGDLGKVESEVRRLL